MKDKHIFKGSCWSNEGPRKLFSLSQVWTSSIQKVWLMESWTAASHHAIHLFMLVLADAKWPKYKEVAERDGRRDQTRRGRDEETDAGSWDLCIWGETFFVLSNDDTGATRAWRTERRRKKKATEKTQRYKRQKRNVRVLLLLTLWELVYILYVGFFFMYFHWGSSHKEYQYVSVTAGAKLTFPVTSWKNHIALSSLDLWSHAKVPVEGFMCVCECVKIHEGRRHHSCVFFFFLKVNFVSHS